MQVKFINFWDGFNDIKPGEPLNKWFFADLVGGVPTIDGTADVTFSSIFGETPASGKVIQFSGESYCRSPEKFVANLICEQSRNTTICLPFAIAYLQSCPKALEAITSQRKFTSIPEKFCCFIVSNPNCAVRNKMFQMLSKWKRVDSWGKVFNNVGALEGDWTSDSVKTILSQYKFVICFENRWIANYVTEKIVNPFIAGCVPIYWGSEHVLHIFNRGAFLYLRKEQPTDADLQNFCEEIKRVDNDDTLYLKMRNATPLRENRLPREYSLGQIKKQLRNLLN